MKISLSIQRRVFIIFGGFTLLLTLVYSATNVLIAYVVEDEVLEKVLAYEAQVIERTFQREGRIIQPRVDYMTLYLEPEKAPAEIAKAYENNTLTSEVFTEDKVHYHIQFLYFDENNSAILVAEVTPFLTVSNASDEILILFFTVSIIALFLSIWFAYQIASKTTKPISTLANEVMLQQYEKEPMTFSANKTSDEIGYLAHTIEVAINDLKMLAKRESDFNRDVSHELRTPLTVLNNTLSLAEKRSLSKAEVTELQKSAAQMNYIVTTLLALARSESIAGETISLRSLLEDCILSLHTKLARKKLNINLDVSDVFKLKVNKQLMTLLISNLIENAIQYTSGVNILIRLHDQQLFIENEIVATISQEKMDRLTEKNVKQIDSIGFGQGLYLVKRIIERLGWHFKIASNNTHFQFVICLKN